MSLGDVIARLAVNLTLETAAFEEGADAAERRLNQSAKRFEQIGGKMMAMGAKMTLAFTAPVLAMGKSVLGLADSAKDMQNTAKIAGETFEQFQRGAGAAKSIGVEFDKFGDILKDTREKLGDFAANGGGELADFFTNVAPKVGVTIDMFRDLSGSQALQLYYDSLVKAGVPQQQMVFYMESIADEGSALIPILANNGKLMKELGGTAAVISDEDAANLARYTQAQSDLSTSFTKLQIALAKTGLVEAITAVVDKIGGLVDWFAELPGPVLSVGVALAAFVAAMGPVLVILGTIISSGATVFAAFSVIGTAMASTGTVAGGATVAFAALRAAVTTFIAALGPWGLAIGLVTAALVLFINAARDGEKASGGYAKALDASNKASKEAEKSANDLAAAHGKVREALIAAMRDQAEKIRKNREEAKTALLAAQAELTRARAYQAAQNVGTTGAPGYAAGFIRGQGDKAVAKAQTNEAAAQKTFENLTASLTSIQKALAKPEAPIFSSAAKPEKKPKAAAKTMATAAQQQKELDQLAMEELQAKLDLATNAEARADLSFQILALEKKQRFAEVESNDQYTADQKKAQIAYLERLYGARAPASGDIEVNNSLQTQILNRDLDEKELRQKNDMLAMRAGTLQAMADAEPDNRERVRLEVEALRLQQEIQRNLLEQQIATGQIADADKARALLASQQSAERQQQDVRNMSPLQRYGYDLRNAVTNINDAMESIQVDALDGITNGLAGAIAGTQKLGDVFKNISQQIIADLARIAIQKAITGGLTKVLGGLFGGGGGSMLNVSGLADNTLSAMPKITGAYASGTRSAARGLALVGERGPELVQFSGGQRVYNNADSKAMMGGRASMVRIEPSPYFNAVVDQRAAGVAAPMAGRAAVAGSTGAQVAIARKSSRIIP